MPFRKSITFRFAAILAVLLGGCAALTACTHLLFTVAESIPTSSELDFADGGAPVEGLRILVIDSSDRAVFCGTTDSNGEVDTAYRNPNAPLDDPSYTIIAGDTTRGYREFTWAPGSNTFDVDDDNSYALPSLPMGAIAVTPSDANAITLSTASGYYYLSADHSWDGTAFIFSANDITLDARGHKITWQNRAPISIVNRSFETAGGTEAQASNWTLSANADRYAGNFLSKQVNETNGHSLRFTAPCANQESVNNTAVTLQTGVAYTLAANAYHNAGAGVTLRVQLVGATETFQVSFPDPFNRGMAYSSTVFTPTTDTSYTLKVVIEGAAGVSSSFGYVDGIELGRVNEHAVRTTSNKTGCRVTNAIIVQGQHSPAAGTPSGVDNAVRSFTNLEFASGRVDHCVIYQAKHDYSVSAGDSSQQFDHNVVIGRGKFTSNRDQNYAFIHRMPFAANANIHHSIYDYEPHGAIFQDAGCTVRANGFIGREYHTNGFAVLIRDALSATVEDNYLAVYSRGLHVSGDCTGSVLSENTGWSESLANNQEYAGCVLEGNYAIQFDGGIAEATNNHVRSYATECHGTAFRDGPLHGQGKNLHDNTFEAHTETSTYHAVSLSLKTKDSDDSIHLRNTLISNNIWIGRNIVDADGVFLEDCTFTRVVTTGITWRPFTVDPNGLPNFRNIIIHNPSYGASTVQGDLDHPVVREDSYATDTTSSFTVEQDNGTDIFSYSGGTRTP